VGLNRQPGLDDCEPTSAQILELRGLMSAACKGCLSSRVRYSGLPRGSNLYLRQAPGTGLDNPSNAYTLPGLIFVLPLHHVTK
jgi:hypothetical protein